MTMTTIGAFTIPIAALSLVGGLSESWLSFVCLLLIAAGVYLAWRSLGWNKFLVWLEFAYFVRFQLTGAALIALILPAGYFLVPSIFIGLFDAQSPLSFGFVVYAALQLAFTIMITYRLTRVYGPERFERMGELPPMRLPTWKNTGLFALLAAPPVAVLSYDTAILWWEKLAGIAAAFLLSLGVLWLTARLHVYIEGEGGQTARYLYPPFGFMKYIPSSGRSEPGKLVDRALRSAVPAQLRPGILKGSGNELTLRSGHQLAATALAIQLAMYLILGFATSPSVPDREPAAMFYVLFLLALLTWFFSGLAFFFDIIRLPVLTACLAASLLFGFIKTDHVFDLQKPTVSAVPLPPGKVVEVWEHRRANDDGKAPMAIVATAGGGIRAAAWTAEALTRLTESCRVMPGGHSFASSLVLVSAVSGGSVGAMYVIGAYDQGNPPADLSEIRTAASQSSLSAVGWGLLYPDLVRIIPGVGSVVTPALGESVDRGWALEREWVNHWPGHSWKSRPTVREWSEDVQSGIRPAVIFNATASETGQRFLAGSTLLPPDPEQSADYRPFIEFPEHFEAFDLPVSTAVRLSATFPWVSPMPRSSAGDAQYRVHVGDGGYYDNSGVLSAVEWLVSAQGSIKEHPVYLVMIDATPAFPPQGASWTWQRQLFAPAGSLLSVRTSSQFMRGQLELKLAADLLTKSGLEITPIYLRYPPETSSPLSWHLTPSQMSRIGQEWKDLKGDKVKLLQDLHCGAAE
jgi:hypothetical protein